MNEKEMQQMIDFIKTMRMGKKEKAALIRQCREGNASAFFIVNAKMKQHAAS